MGILLTHEDATDNGQPETWRLVNESLIVQAIWANDHWQLSALAGATPILNWLPNTARLDQELANPVLQECFGRTLDDEVGELLLVGRHGTRYFSVAVRLVGKRLSTEVAERWDNTLGLDEVHLNWEVAIDCDISICAAVGFNPTVRHSRTDGSRFAHHRFAWPVLKSLAAPLRLQYSLAVEISPNSLRK